MEAAVAALHDVRDALQAERRELGDALRQREDEIQQLNAMAARLSEKLDEEKRLRAHVHDLAVEVNEAQAGHQAEVAASAQQRRDADRTQQGVADELALVQGEVTRVKEGGAAELHALARQVADRRREVQEKEAALTAATADNAAKQSMIAQFEEEKRQLEREQLARKAAAAHAAKAALNELTY
jgi:hypothetical protein